MGRGIYLIAKTRGVEGSRFTVNCDKRFLCLRKKSLITGKESGSSVYVEWVLTLTVSCVGGQLIARWAATGE